MAFTVAALQPSWVSGNAYLNDNKTLSSSTRTTLYILRRAGLWAVTVAVLLAHNPVI